MSPSPASSPLDSALQADSGWRHDLRTVGVHGRVVLADIAEPDARFRAELIGDRWRLERDDKGQQVSDSRRRLVIPIGVRLLLRIEDRVGVSWRDESVMLWPTHLLDAAVGCDR